LKSAIFLALLVLALISFQIKQPVAGFVFLIAAFFVALAWLLQKLFSGTKKVAKALGKGVPAEVEKAEGQFPAMSNWEEGLKEAGSATGKQLFAPGQKPYRPGEMDAYKWRFKGMSSASSGIKKFADAFKKLLGM